MTQDRRSSGSLLAAGVFTVVAGLIIGYSGLFSWSGPMMIIGFVIAVLGAYMAMVGLIRWALSRRKKP